MRKRNEGGFTLIELMIVIAIIAIIAAIAIPSLLRSRIAANEAAAIGALRSMVAAQEEFRMADIVDQDSDGAGEYGWLQELCGDENPRGKTSPVSPEFFDRVFGVVDANGYATKTGYYFRMLLPTDDDAGGNAIGEPSGAGTAVAANADAQETRWACYAWPSAYNSTGKRAFVVNQAGQVFATGNEGANQSYSGTTKNPAANAAYVTGVTNINGALCFSGGGATAVDAGTWAPAD